MNINDTPSTAARNGRLDRRTVLRFGAGAAATVAVGSLIAACDSDSGSGSGDGGSGNGGAGGEQVTLKVIGFEVTPEEKGSELDLAYQAFLSDFQEQNPDIKIESVDTPPDFDTQIVVDLAAGTAPDIWSQDASSLANLVSRDLLLDGRALMEAYPDLTTDRFFPQVLAINTAEDGGIYGFPNDFTPMVTYLNPTLFEAAGLEVPQDGWTWDDQLAAAQQLTLDSAGRNSLDPDFDSEDVVQWGYRISQYAYQWVYRLWQNGGDVISPDFTTASGYLDSPESIEAIKWYSDLVLKHKVSPTPSALENMTNASDSSTLFLQGKFAMFDSGHWSLVGLSGNAEFAPEKVGVVPQPASTQAATVLYQSSFVLRYDLPEEKMEAAARFVDAATSLGYQDTKSITGIAIPANEEAANNSLSNPDSAFADLDEVFVAATESGRPPYGAKIGAYPTIEETLNGVMEQILRGASVEEQVSKAVGDINRELSK